MTVARGLAPSLTARALRARRESPWKRAVRFLILLITLVILVLAWQVTGIDPRKLTNAANAGPILSALVTPDVMARETSTTELQVPFVAGQGSDQPVQVSNRSGQSVRITPGAAEPGQTVVFEGSGFEPNAVGQLRFVLPDGRDVLFTRDLQTDGRGAFHEER